MVASATYPARAFSSVSVKLPEVMGLHRLDQGVLPTKADFTKEEMMTYFTNMANMRRLEI